MDIKQWQFYDGFGYRDPSSGQYWMNQADYDDWTQRNNAWIQAGKDGNAQLLRQWGAPAGMDVWDALDQVRRANYGAQYQQQNPTSPVNQNPYGTTTSWGYQGTYNPPASTSWNTPTGNNTPAAGSSASVPQPNTSGQGGSNGFLPDYYQTGNNPYRGSHQDNNPNLVTNRQQSSSYGQLPYLMS